ncbi:unnamed protein product [Zymoseptoria tritici ST99CH_1A5]|uniref:Uncharacterized protein n=1 Tax=Zymoseptoria tritici ST99CH_1A5 TaxID=1276529 RepID=A0A1Y6LX14_ZYMTR|nr:unnamed protein product [Zymoseptoria tritici ST99CH_1A5]
MAGNNDPSQRNAASNQHNQHDQHNQHNQHDQHNPIDIPTTSEPPSWPLPQHLKDQDRNWVFQYEVQKWCYYNFKFSRWLLIDQNGKKTAWDGPPPTAERPSPHQQQQQQQQPQQQDQSSAPLQSRPEPEAALPGGSTEFKNSLASFCSEAAENKE